MARILISPLKWGLGHATRDIPVIRVLLAHNHDITIAASGRALDLLKLEFPQCTFIDFDDYPAPYSASRFFLPKFTANIPRIMKAIRNEKRRFDTLLKKHDFDLIISDNRFGIYSDKIPSVFISHQIRFIMPSFLKPFERFTQYFNTLFHKHFQKVIVPDNFEPRLSGRLSEPMFKISKERIYYAGVLCSIEKHDVKEDIDYLISVSGPEPQRTLLEELMLEQVKTLKGKKFIVLGKPDLHTEQTLDDGTVVKSYANPEEMTMLMNRAKCIITRSGYTTMMEIAELGKTKGLFLPTPGQTEQEYLSKYYAEKGWFYSTSQYKINLIRDIKEIKNFKGFPSMPKSKDNAEKLYKEVLEPLLKKQPKTANT